MIKLLLVLPFILISFVANANVDNSASDLPLLTDNSMAWRSYVVSDRIDPQGEDVAEYLVNEVFKGREIVIDNTTVTVNGVCKYEYSKEKMTPLQYWNSQKTVDLYKTFLSGYNVKLKNTLGLITPVNPSIECVYPFSYFIEVDNSLVFVLKNRAIIYSQVNEEDKVSVVACAHKEQTPEQIYEHGYIVDCYYKNMDILDSYQKYRSSLVSDDRAHLQEKIALNKSFSMKCDNGCIVVEYKWNGPDHLVITQQFDGGETRIYFSKEEQGSRIVTKSFPD
ncbi:hypothetical protein [Yersinia similis]|uniref:Uncharacterized protein n=1 Tax=Yersinia similis TaxID=367190 RepID=A0A0T9R1Z6_9GAMM|nr:hypothetical protein [Yersinia similis]CNG10849.1 Uncharacterised protein [Yersinia similis]CNI40570.1 Uncharacterised protein [Yersinia similis]